MKEEPMCGQISWGEQTNFINSFICNSDWHSIRNKIYEFSKNSNGYLLFFTLQYEENHTDLF